MKRNIEMPYRGMLCRKIVLLWIGLLIIVSIGCTSLTKGDRTNHASQETLENMEEPLRVFYDGTGYYLLKSYMDANPEINIKLVNCIPDVDGEIDLKTIISENGVPDLILAREEVSVYLSEWYEEGYIVDLVDYCSNDTSINTEDYFPETFEVFKEAGNIYALPLGISMDFMLTSESKYNDSAFAKLEEGYTGRELLNILLEEVEKVKEPGEFFSEMNMSPMSFMYCLGGLTKTSDGIQMDEELFKQVYEFAYRNGKIAAEAGTFWSEQGKSFNPTTGYAFPCALEPRRFEGKFTVDIVAMEDAPALVLSYAETAYQYHSEEGIKAIYLPTADDGSKFQARVKVWGAIGGESPRKQLAYDLLRALMDEEIDSFGIVRGPIPVGASLLNVNVYPINRGNAISLLDRFESQTTHLFYGHSSSEKYLEMLERTDVSDEEKEKHKKVLSSISGLYCWTKELMEIDDIFGVYYDANILDYENCYLAMLNTLNSKATTEYIPDVSESASGSEEDSSEVTEMGNNETVEVNELKEKIRDTEVGGTFFFGEIEQDNNLDNGSELIEWIVLDKTESEAFVISRKVLEYLTFSKYDNLVGVEGALSGDRNNFTWNLDRNQQRAWLTNELYENGFTENEKKIILLTHNIAADDSEVWEQDSDDHLYVPSKEELEDYMPDIHLRQAEITAYVAERANKESGDYICWTLRTVGATSRYTMQILESGEFGSIYTDVPNGVRPVMRLDISDN